jgi:hypothetical protein
MLHDCLLVDFSDAEHVWGKYHAYGFRRAVLAAGAAVPTLVRVAVKRKPVPRLTAHVDHVAGTHGGALAASVAKFIVKRYRHDRISR